MIKLLSTVWHLLMLSISLMFLGSFTLVTISLGKSALQLHKKGLISLTELSHSLQNGGTKKSAPGNSK